MPTIYKSIQLQAGEPFILPPGAKLISSTNRTALTSTCDNVSNLQDLLCYTFVFGNAATDGNAAQLFEAGQFSVVGFRINTVYYPFEAPFQSSTTSSPVGQYNLQGIIAAVNNKTGGILVNPVVGEHNEGAAGIIEFITFKSTPTIASSLELVMRAATSLRFNITEFIDLSVKPRLNSELSAYSGLPACI